MQVEWRGMAGGDLPVVKALGDAIHRDFPERFDVLAERYRLYPQGCRVLSAVPGTETGARAENSAVLGYALSHPWGEVPPALDTLLGALPMPPTTYYLHDLALAPALRGTGAARELVAWLAATAQKAGFRHLSLTAVGDSHGFWARQGFAPIGAAADDEGALARALASYGATARLLRLPLAAGMSRTKPEWSVRPR